MCDLSRGSHVTLLDNITYILYDIPR